MQWRKKKDCYQLTWAPKILVLIIFFFAAYLSVKNIYSFLAPQKPVVSKVLVIEGWLSDYALQECLDLFNKDSYDLMLITGGPLNTGYVLMNYKSTAQVAKETLLRLGAPPEKVIAISRKLVWSDRTFQSALVLKKYLMKEMPLCKSFNLVSLGAHSRRSWLLFNRAMPNYKIGIITLKEKLYDTNYWWRTSKGLRSIITEFLGYFYVLLFFFPSI